jgi:hypothetical protein
MSHRDRAPAAVGDGDCRAAGVSDRPVLGGGTGEALRGGDNVALASGGGKGPPQGKGGSKGHIAQFQELVQKFKYLCASFHL